MVTTAMQRFNEARHLKHSALTGRTREIAASSIIEPFLFEHLNIGHGKITDYSGKLSRESDCIIYSTRHLPPLMYDPKLGVFPLDAVFAVIEIKSRLTSSTLDEAYTNAVSLWQLRLSTGLYEEREGQRTDFVVPPVPALFAFESDLQDRRTTEIERYLRMDPEGSTRPTIHMLCVVGKGFWWYKFGHRQERGAWVHCKATDNYDEVITFLALLTSVIAARSWKRPAPMLEPYLVNLRIPGSA